MENIELLQEQLQLCCIYSILKQHSGKFGFQINNIVKKHHDYFDLFTYRSKAILQYYDFNRIVKFL